MAFVKALIPGAVLTWIVSIILGSNGSHGGFLTIHQIHLAGYDFYWSWPLFIAVTALAWGIIALMD